MNHIQRRLLRKLGPVLVLGGMMSWLLVGGGDLFAQKTITVCAGGCNFDKIQAAVDAAAAGDTIQVQDGTYQENVVIRNKQDLTLQGAGRDVVTLDGSAGVADKKPAVFIEKSQKITIKGFQIVKGRRGVEGDDTTGLVVADNQFDSNLRQGILLQRAEATLTGNLVRNTQLDQDGANGTGIQMFDSQVKLKDNTVSGSKSYGVSAQGTSEQSGSIVTIEKNTITGNSAPGIGVFNASKATLDDNTITGNVLVGIDLADSSQATINNTRVTETKKDSNGNRGFGIVVEGNSNGTIRNSAIQQNAVFGVLVRDKAQATVQQNTITNNNGHGILSGYNSSAALDGNTITGNGGDGIALQDSAQATIQKNTISNNKSAGVVLLGSSKASLDDNTIAGNGGEGIALQDSAQATITNNQISGSAGEGIFATDSSKLTVTGSTISGGAIRGILVVRAAQATIQNNTISGNKESGIVIGQGAIQNETVQAEISHNAIQNNGNCGAVADSDPGITITGQGNTISGNAKGQLCNTPSKFPTGFGGGK